MSDVMRNVIDGEELSGHGRKEVGYPEIHIYDGQGPGKGSGICTISHFHSCRVRIDGDNIRLSFECRLPLTIHGGIVQYCDPATWNDETRAAAKRVKDAINELCR